MTAPVTPTLRVDLVAWSGDSAMLAALPANQALSVAGRAEVRAWLDKNGEPQAGLSLVADELATLKGKPRPPQGMGDTRQGRQGEDSPPRPQRARQAPVAYPRNNEGPLRKTSLAVGAPRATLHSPVLEASYECGLAPPGVTSDLLESSAGSSQTEQILPSPADLFKANPPLEHAHIAHRVVTIK